jgi:hypothetical protein
MPGVGKAAQAVVATRRLEDSSHPSMMTIVSCLCETMATPTDGLSLAPALSRSLELFGTNSSVW